MRYAVIKLINGEEIIAKVEPAPNPTEIIIHKPVLVNRNNTNQGPYMQVSHYLMFSKYNKATIKTKNIVVLEYELEDNAIESYNDFVDGNNSKQLTLNDKQKLDALLKELQDTNYTMEDEWVDDAEAEANTTIH